MSRQTILRWVIVLTLVGLVDALYLAYSALSHNPLACSITGLDGCNIVAGSSYSRLFGIPLAVFGVIFYGVILITALRAKIYYDLATGKFLLAAALVGALSSCYFMYLQVFVIKALCVYCALSFVASVLIFVFCAYLYSRNVPIPPVLKVVE